MVSEAQVWKLLEEVPDPEVPVLSVLDLGIVREVSVDEAGVHVTITPTYSGCPAMNTIEADIKGKLQGMAPVEVKEQLSPAWTSDWLSEAGKQKLKDYGIAPPVEGGTGLFQTPKVPCPRCGSAHTKSVSQFGSTSCKAHYQCLDCFEPFDYFKCHR